MSGAPTEIRLKQGAQLLVVSFDGGESFELPCEYLRVFSPSAEVRGHGLAEPLLVLGKQAVTIKAIEPVGNYAVKLVFSDGHDTGLYTWGLLHELGRDRERNWARYLARVASEGAAKA